MKGKREEIVRLGRTHKDINGFLVVEPPEPQKKFIKRKS